MKKGVVAAAGYADPSKQKVRAPSSGQLFNTSNDVVKPEIRLVVSLYVDELLN